jgi:hemerythrin-like metal-binding protein
MTYAAMPLAWTERYAIGVAEIDAQHRALLDILNELNRAARKESGSGHAKGVLWKIFEELNEYAAYHFLSEEKLMQLHLAAENSTAKHIAQHRNYWVTISDFKQRYRDGDAQVTDELMSFLNVWWIEHIQGIDKQMGTELNQKRVR